MKENGEQCLFIRMKPSTKVAPTMAWLNLKFWKTVKDLRTRACAVHGKVIRSMD